MATFPLLTFFSKTLLYTKIALEQKYDFMRPSLFKWFNSFESWLREVFLKLILPCPNYFPCDVHSKYFSWVVVASAMLLCILNLVYNDGPPILDSFNATQVWQLYTQRFGKLSSNGIEPFMRRCWNFLELLRRTANKTHLDIWPRNSECGKYLTSANVPLWFEMSPFKENIMYCRLPLTGNY